MVCKGLERQQRLLQSEREDKLKFSLLEELLSFTIRLSALIMFLRAHTKPETGYELEACSALRHPAPPFFKTLARAVGV